MLGLPQLRNPVIGYNNLKQVIVLYFTVQTLRTIYGTATKIRLRNADHDDDFHWRQCQQ